MVGGRAGRARRGGGGHQGVCGVGIISQGTCVHASHAAALTLGKSHPCTVRSALPLIQRTGSERKGARAWLGLGLRLGLGLGFGLEFGLGLAYRVCAWLG